MVIIKGNNIHREGLYYFFDLVSVGNDDNNIVCVVTLCEIWTQTRSYLSNKISRNSISVNLTDLRI